MDESEFLYGDIFEHLEDGQAVIKTSYHELEERIQHLTQEGQELRSQIDDLKSQNEKLSKQNEVLIRNISCLFKTAKMEIARKDKMIRSLQEGNLKQSANGPESEVQGDRLATNKHGTERKSASSGNTGMNDSKERENLLPLSCNGEPSKKRGRPDDESQPQSKPLSLEDGEFKSHSVMERIDCGDKPRNETLSCRSKDHNDRRRLQSSSMRRETATDAFKERRRERLDHRHHDSDKSSRDRESGARMGERGTQSSSKSDHGRGHIRSSIENSDRKLEHRSR